MKEHRVQERETGDDRRWSLVVRVEGVEPKKQREEREKGEGWRGGENAKFTRFDLLGHGAMILGIFVL